MPTLLARLGEGSPIPERCVLVVAHPDDETLGMGLRLSRFDDLRLVHVTPGAPRDDGDARRSGFEDAAAYARTRAAELDEALRRLEARPRERHDLGFTDGEVVFGLEALVERLQPILLGAAAVFTHPYEGGHPDHDATCAAVQFACRRLGATAPMRLEFASYHLGKEGQASGAFWPDPACPATTPASECGDLVAKRAAFAAYASQASILEWFRPEIEAYREAPVYDFAAPPPPGQALYDQWGWTLTSTRWRDLVAAVADEGPRDGPHDVRRVGAPSR